jgi:hypothetical protein
VKRFWKLSTVWLQLHSDAMGAIVRIGSFATVAAIVMAAIFLPPARASTVEGIVTGFGFRETDQGSYRVMHVETAAKTYTVRAPNHLDCRVGDRTPLSLTRHWWGTVAGARRLCQHPPFRN